MNQPEPARDIRDVVQDLLADPESKIDRLTFTPIVGDDLKRTLYTRVDIRIRGKAEPDPSPNALHGLLEHGVSSDGCLTIQQIPVLGEDGHIDAIKTTIEVTDAKDDTQAGDRVMGAYKNLTVPSGFTREHFEFTRPPAMFPPSGPATAKIVVVDKKKAAVSDVSATWASETAGTWIERARNLLPVPTAAGG